MSSNSTIVLTSKNTNTYETIQSLEIVNRQLLENQSFLHEENKKLQKDVSKLTEEIQLRKNTTVDLEVLQDLQQQKDNLVKLNANLKKKIKYLKNTPRLTLSKSDAENDKKEKLALNEAVENLGNLVELIKKQSERVVIKPHLKNVSQLIADLTKKIEQEESKTKYAEDSLRNYRNNDEKFILRDKICDMKHLISELEVENTKLKFESEQLLEDIEKLKFELKCSVDLVQTEKNKNDALEDEKEKMKQNISIIEHDNLRLKREMIEELNEANRVKRLSIDTEIALQRMTEAYETKKREALDYLKELDAANIIINSLKNKNMVTGIV